MTSKEISALRKSGQLQEALDAAEREYAQNANIYTAGALFWCLNDLVKQNKGDMTETVARMEDLYNVYGVNNEYMKGAMTSISRRVQPHYQELQDLIAHAKSGENITSEYRTFENLFKLGELSTSLYNDFGWLTYYALKQTALENAHARKVLLNNYLKLELPKPSVLHSRILGEAIKVEQNTPLLFRIRDFIRIWGLENLQEEDWEQFHTDSGNVLPSSVEKLIGVYIKEIKNDGVAAPEEFDQLVDKALIKYPQNQNMPYFKAAVLISQGKKNDALAYYKDLILRFPSKFYYWSQASELVEDVNIKIGLISKALLCGAEDEFLGTVRLKMATLLIQNNLLANAKYELEIYQKTYVAKGWSLKPEFWQIYNQLTSVESAVNNNTVYTEYCRIAEEFIYSSLPTILAIKVSESQDSDRYHPGKKITTWCLRSDKDIIRLRKPFKFKLEKHTPNGVAFDIKIRDSKIVWINRHSGSIVVPWLKEHYGEVHLRTDRNGKKFAIIDDSYIADNLLTGIHEGQSIKIMSLQKKDGRWAAISVIKQ